MFVDGRIAASTVWREALAIIRRYPSATVVPAVVLTAFANIPYYYIEASGLAWEQLITFLTSAFAFYLYVAYAEEVVVEAERGVDRITMGGVLRELR